MLVDQQRVGRLYRRSTTQTKLSKGHNYTMRPALTRVTWPQHRRPFQQGAVTDMWSGIHGMWSPWPCLFQNHLHVWRMDSIVRPWLLRMVSSFSKSSESPNQKEQTAFQITLRMFNLLGSWNFQHCDQLTHKGFNRLSWQTKAEKLSSQSGTLTMINPTLSHTDWIWNPDCG